MTHCQQGTRAIVVTYPALAALYAAVGYGSHGYDDEFFNIAATQRYGPRVVEFVLTEDVHPPGSYFVNWVLYALLGDWSLVRLATALFAVASIIYAIESLRRSHGAIAGLAAVVLLGLNPALLMWCTGVRWYAYFVPILVWICITPKEAGRWFWIKPSMGLVILGYFGYAVFLVAPAVLLLYWRNCRSDTREKAKSVALYASFAALAYAPQLYVFLSVHLAHRADQLFSLRQSLIGFAVAQLGNQGVFPISVGGISSTIGTLGLFAIGIWRAVKQQQTSEFMAPYWVGVAAFIATGIAGKFRNLTVLCGLQALWLSTIIVGPHAKRLAVAAFAFLSVGNIIGTVNVVSHQDTTKNSWDLPCAQALTSLAALSSDCQHDLVVLTHDPTLTHLLGRNGYTTMSPYAQRVESQNLFEGRHRCVVALKTFPGSIKDDDIQKMYTELESIDFRSRSYFHLGRDANFKMKRLVDARYPEFRIEGIVMREAQGLTLASTWMPRAE